MAIIRVSRENKSRVASLRKNRKESFDGVINRLIDFYEDDDPLTEEDIEGIREALNDNRTLTSEQLRKEPDLV